MQTGEAPLVQDSAGVSIVTNSAAQLANAPRWPLSELPVLEFNSSPADDHPVFDVRAILNLSNKRIAVLNAGTFEVFVLDQEGNLTTTFGREGDGPGEFREPTSLLLMSDDSVGVYDSRHRRLSVFDQTGTLGREVKLEVMGERSPPYRLLPLDNGNLAVFTSRGFGDDNQTGVFRPESEFYQLDSRGSIEVSYGMFPGIEMFINEGAMGMVLFGPRTQVATMGDDFIVGTAESPEVKAFGPKGTLSGVFRWPDRDRVISPERFNAFLDLALETLPEAGRGQARTMFSEAPKSEKEPAYEDLLVSDQAHLWVGSWQGPEVWYLRTAPPAREWLVFDASGVLIASVQTPEGFRPLLVHGEVVFGGFVDELGVESVRAYSIEMH